MQITLLRLSAVGCNSENALDQLEHEDENEKIGPAVSLSGK